MNRELPAILITGDTSVQEVEATGLKACTLVHKPIDSEKLISMIRTAAQGADKHGLNSKTAGDLVVAD